ARRPGVVFIHGGPIPADLRPAPTDWGVYRSYGELAAASGFVGATFNHRYHSRAQLDEAASDIAAAIQYLRAHAAPFHLDPQGHHGFDVEDDHPRTREIIARSIAFIKTHLEDDRRAGSDAGPQADESSGEGEGEGWRSVS